MKVKTTRLLIIYGAVQKWIWEDLIASETLYEFFYDIDLFIHLLSYEDTALVKDWYTNNKDANERLEKLKNTINTKFKEDKRHRYSNYELD